jgi:hypothetical protein
MNRIRISAAVMLALSAACSGPASRSDASFPALASGSGARPSNEESPRPDGPIAAPRLSPADAKHFRIETVMFEMPLAIAEDLYGRADENDSTLGAPLDESRVRAALELLVARHPEIVRSTRPDLVLAAREVAYLPLRAASSEHPARSLASDFLELRVRAAPAEGWPELELEVRIHWMDPRGRVLGNLPSSTSAIPCESGDAEATRGSSGSSSSGGRGCEWLEIACLPSRNLAASENTRAVLAFLLVTPLP